jgi:predicted alpha/beta-hydrolase family hydrolase
VGAALVVAFGFPLVAPNGKSRQHELDEAGVPVLIFQGTRDEFGVPRANARKQREVIRIEGADHALERPRAQEDPLEQIVTTLAERLRDYEE